MAFLTKLTSFEAAVLIFCIFLVLSGTLWGAIHGEPGNNRSYYLWPIVGIIVLLILIVAWVRVVFS